MGRDRVPVSSRKALRTIVVRATSPKVPICGRPEGPIAGLEQCLLLARPFQPRNDLAGLPKGQALLRLRGLDQGRVGERRCRHARLFCGVISPR